MKTRLSLVVVVCKPFHLFVFCLEHLLHQEHLPLLLDKFITVFHVFLTFTGHRKALELRYVDLALDLGVDSQLAGLDVGLAQLTQAALPDRPVFFPNAFVLVGLLFLRLPLLLVVLKSKDHLTQLVLRNYKRVRVSITGRGCRTRWLLVKGVLVSIPLLSVLHAGSHFVVGGSALLRLCI